jgi:hypothetical protein
MIINDLIYIEPSWNRIAINVSGGADSALLSYLLIDHINTENIDIEVHIISNVRMWKTRPWQRYDSLNVYEWLQKHFPNVKMIRHEGFIAPDIEYGNIGPAIKDQYGQMKSGDQITARAYSEFICHTYNIQAVYAGITLNPQHAGIINGMPDREINTIEDRIQIVNGITVCHPLRYTSKDWVIKQYKDHDLLDLFELTRSCEGDNDTFPEVFKGLDYTNYKPGQAVPECGKCFWCQEREWAIEQNK